MHVSSAKSFTGKLAECDERIARAERNIARQRGNIARMAAMGWTSISRGKPFIIRLRYSKR